MLLDDREHGLRALLPTEKVGHLSVGDIWVGLNESDIAKNGLLIERKSAADLEASILDGRYREQRSRLMAFATEKGAHPMYIIEGSLDRFGARLAKQALLKHLTRLSLRYHISIFQTDSVKETAELCKILDDQWTADPTTFEQPATMTYVETRGATRESNSDDPYTFATSVLKCCRGISAAGAKALLDEFKDLKGIWEASAEQLAAVKTGKQRLGAKASRLYSLLHTTTKDPPIHSP